ncbi:MAG TPA: cohesin domain-containing protein, partial [Phycisphaerae bacterium]|nr:cohesin domain-containing protein [Phycisphaerae bacterium]
MRISWGWMTIGVLAAGALALGDVQVGSDRSFDAVVGSEKGLPSAQSCRTVADTVGCTALPATLENGGLLVVHYNAGTTMATAGPASIAYVEIRDAQFRTSPTLPDPENYALNVVLPALTIDGSNLPPALTTLDLGVGGIGEPAFGGMPAMWTIDYYNGANTPGNLVGTRAHTVLFGSVCDATAEYNPLNDGTNPPGVFDDMQLARTLFRIDDERYHSVNEPEVHLPSATIAETGTPIPGLQPVEPFLLGESDLTEAGFSTNGALLTGSNETFVNVWRVSNCADNTISSVVSSRLGLDVQDLKRCYKEDDIVTVDVNMSCLEQEATGFQAFVTFDDSILQFEGATSAYTSDPFALHVQPIATAEVAPGEINIDGSVNYTSNGTADDALLATLKFKVLAGHDGAVTSIDFRTSPPFASELSDDGAPIATFLSGSREFGIDQTPVALTCPADIVVDTDPDSCVADIDPGVATASDACGIATLDVVRDDAQPLNAPFSSDCSPGHATTITWTATDCAGHVSTCAQTVTVTDNEAPQFNCPSDRTIECDQSSDPVATGSPAWFQGFESDAEGWFDLDAPDGTITRVASGTGGITSADGGFHALVHMAAADNGVFTRFGGYSSTWPGTFAQFVDVYLDPAAGTIGEGWFWDTAINNTSGTWLEAGGVGALKATDGFWWIAADADGGAYPGGSGGGVGFKVTTTGWYTLESEWGVWMDGGTPRLTRNTFIYAQGNPTPLYSVFNNTAHPISSTGGHRYGWFAVPSSGAAPLSFDLPIDNVRLGGMVSDNCDPAPAVTYTDDVTPGACMNEFTITRTWRVEDNCGNFTTCDQVITVQDTEEPAITYCPADLSVQCVDDVMPGIPFGVADGGIGIYYNDNGGGENPANQAYLRAQFDATNTHGAEFTFDNSPLTGLGFPTWAQIYSGLVPPATQFGLDLVLEAPTSTGNPATPVLTAVDNVDSTPGNATPAGPVAWAINDYKGSSPNNPGNPATAPTNSILRGPSPITGTEIAIFRNDLSLSGSVYTSVIEGRLTADGINHWFNPATLHSPMSNYNLNGDLYFAGTLTYDTVTDSNPLMDFYSGPVTLTANFPSAATGIALATDNCTPFPAISFSDADNGGTGCPGDPLVITRTWTATDACNLSTNCVQII